MPISTGISTTTSADHTGNLQDVIPGSTMFAPTVTMDKILHPKDCQVLSLDDSGFLQFF